MNRAGRSVQARVRDSDDEGSYADAESRIWRRTAMLHFLNIEMPEEPFTGAQNHQRGGEVRR